MYKSSFVYLLTSSIALAGIGCTHSQLRYSTVKQSETVTRVYEQQVLDNLAMFVVNNHAVPYFATASAGSADVTDGGTFSLGPINTGINMFAIGGKRDVKEGWTLEPVKIPTNSN